MANRFLKAITPKLKKTFSNAMKALLSETGATVPCKLIYPGTIQICTNCELNPMTQRSSGVYKTGGPVPFIKGQCPYCAGEGKREVNPDPETIYLMVVWSYKEWTKFGFNIQNPDGKALSLSDITTLPKIKRAKEIIFNSNVEDYVRHTFRRIGEPNPCGCCVADPDDPVGEMFIGTMWERVG